MSTPIHSADSSPIYPREKLIVIILSAINFDHIMDFVIMMPLGPQFMRVFNITPQAFGVLVSTYTYSAGIFGLLGAFFIDRFDRRKLLMLLFAGFTVGTLLCAVSHSYAMLLFARGVAGAFGGLLGAILFSILADVVPDSRRGAATGSIMSAFSIASGLGVPAGLTLATHFGWNSIFYAVSLFSAIVFVGIIRYIPPITTHLTRVQTLNPGRQVLAVLKESKHWAAFVFITCMIMGGFTVIPYLSPYAVSNVGLSESQLPLIYVFGGTITIFSSKMIGKFADKYGKQKIYLITAAISLPPLLGITLIPAVSLTVYLSLSTIFFVTVSGRLVPGFALISSSVKPAQRGIFMSLISSLQQIAGGTATLIAGSIIVRNENQQLLHYGWVGLLAIIFTLIAMLVSFKVKPSSLH